MKALNHRKRGVFALGIIVTMVSLMGCGANPTSEITETEGASRLERISEELSMLPITQGEEIFLLPHYQIGSGEEIFEGMIASEAEADEKSVKLTVPTGYQLEKSTRQVYLEYDLRDKYETYFEESRDYVNSERWLLCMDEEAKASELQLYYGLCETEQWLCDLYDTGALEQYDVVGKIETAYGEAVLYKNPEIFTTEGETDYYEYYIVLETDIAPVIITFTDYHLELIGQTPINLMKELFAA